MSCCGHKKDGKQMIELWEGIFDYYTNHADTAALRGLLTGGLFNMEAPQNASYPYGTFQVVAITPSNHASDKNFVEDCLVQFNLFLNQQSKISLLTIYDELVNCFDFCSGITVASFTVLSCVREGTIQDRIDGVWQINVTYRIKLEP